MLAPFVRQSRESLTQYAPALAAAFAIESSSGCFPLHALSCEHRQFQNPQSRHFSNSAAGHQRVQLHKLHNVEIDTIWESTVRVDLRSASLQAEYDPQGTMNAVTFHGPRNMRVSRRPIPVLQKPTDIVVEVKLASICGSDMHPYSGRGVLLDDGIIFGHEFVGVVVAAGSEVKTVKLGDRVASAFTSSCGSCFYCSHDLTCRCSHGEAGRFGYIIDGKGPEGIQAEFARVPLADTTVVAVPERVTDIEALMLGDILPTGWYCAARADVGPLANKHGEGISAAVVGCGPVGLMAILAAQAQGATQVFAVDKVPDRLELAKQFGAETINGDDAEAAIASVKDATQGRGVDCAMEAVGHQATVNLGFNMLRMGGTMSSVGLHTEEEFKAFTPWDGYNKNITYRNGRCPARVYMTDILQLLKQKHWGDPFPGEKLITHQVSLHDEAAVREVYDKFERRIDNCTKVLLIP